MERHITKKTKPEKPKKPNQKNKKKKKQFSRSLGLEPCEKDFRIIVVVFFCFFGLGFFVFFGLVFLVFPVWFRSFVILFCSDISGFE